MLVATVILFETFGQIGRRSCMSKDILVGVLASTSFLPPKSLNDFIVVRERKVSQQHNYSSS